MTISLSTNLFSLISYERLARKPLLFKSFTGLTVQKFDDIFNNEITKKYEKYELKRLSYKRKENRKRKLVLEGTSSWI